MKILLVEDNTKLAKNIKQGLTQEGFAVDTVEDGTEAEKKVSINRDEYDLVVLDRMLPGNDGLSICASWREQGISIPVLMLTAMGATEDKVVGLKGGADDYLAKPFDFEELLARIQALLRRPKLATQEKITIGDLMLDTQAHVITLKNKPLTLTLKEFMVLEYLMRNQGKVVTRDELYAHAWDYADLTLSNTVDVHIKNIRRKIKDKSKIIQTVRGVGYKMDI
ncbi:MAG: response regulator transcription factor [Patescibacteria group bacterium]